MGRKEKDQKISPRILTNSETPKILLCIIKEEIRFIHPIVSLLKIHIYIYLNRKIDYSEMCGHSVM